MSTRGSSRASSRGYIPPETPKRLPPNRDDPLSAIIGTSGPVHSAQGVRKFLKEAGWILAGELYDHTKLARIIATVVVGEMTTSKAAAATTKMHARNALIVVAFLLDADITNHISDTLADAVAAKTLTRLKSTASSLATLAAFVAANDTSRADTTIALQKITETLSTIVSTLNTQLDHAAPPGDAATTTNNPTRRPPRQHQALPSQTVTWASVTGANVPISRVFNPEASDRHTKLQQRVIRDSRIVTFNYLTADPTAPQDTTPPGLLALRSKVNKIITIADAETKAPNKTLIRGIMAYTKPDSNKTVLTIELDTPKSVQRILKYASDITLNFLADCLGDTAAFRERPRQLIARFVPCNGVFDPDNSNHISQLEEDNFLPPGSIITTSWLKKPIYRSSSQTLASLKISCKNADIANCMIQEHIFITGHLATIRKDIRAPLRCNKCQHYGHIRANCQGTE
ncbi:hypothetical protein C0991_005182 [Blastosporella zonata]|nr:hypothetical protein C0991_005182 [Blastosporella zonata]